MPADEVARGTDADGSRGRTGARHAAPKAPLFTRFHMPAGKAIASVAMPTAVLMGLGFTSSLALADNGGTTTSNSQKAAEYKDCVQALDGTETPSASPSPSASESTAPAAPSTSASTDAKAGQDAGAAASPDSGSGAAAKPKPSASSGTSGSSTTGSGSSSGSGGTTAPAPSATQSSGGGLLDTIGNTIGDVLSGGKSSVVAPSTSSSTTPTPSASQSPSGTTSSSGSAAKGAVAGTVGDVTKTVTDTTKTVTDTTKAVTDTVKDTTDTVSKTAGDTAKAVQDAASSATATPSADGCAAATDAVGGVDNKVPVAEDPWHLSASSLLLKGADYQGIVTVTTSNGTQKKVLKYVISDGTDIGDLHQTVLDKTSGKTYHVQAAKGSTSTIRGGDTVMYTESISGNLFGLVPVTFSPDSPPPLNIPLIYFTNVKVVQAAQFGGNLHVPGMHVYTTD